MSMKIHIHNHIILLVIKNLTFYESLKYIDVDYHFIQVLKRSNINSISFIFEAFYKMSCTKGFCDNVGMIYILC